jgi:hypothetical protein
MNLATWLPARIAPAALGKWLGDNLANRRTRGLLILLGATVAGAGLVLLDSLDNAMAGRIAELQRRVGRIEQLAGTDWRQRRSETEPLRVQAESRLWEAETDGLAQANFQSWITEQAGGAGLGPIEIRTAINATANNVMKLRQLSAQIGGRFEPEGFFRLLQAIAGHDRLVIVDRLEVQTLPVPHFEMQLVTFLRPARGA